MRLGIDLGGTKIEIIALDDRDQECLRRRVATPQGDYAATVDTMVQLVQEAEQSLGRQGSLGVGTPGALSALNGRIKNANSVCINGQSRFTKARKRNRTYLFRTGTLGYEFGNYAFNIFPELFRIKIGDLRPVVMGSGRTGDGGQLGTLRMIDDALDIGLDGDLAPGDQLWGDKVAQKQ